MAGQTERLSALGRAWRGALLLGLTILFGRGSAIGDDPWWPFGPWRMFSTSASPDRAVVPTIIEVHTEASGQEWVPGR